MGEVIKCGGDSGVCWFIFFVAMTPFEKNSGAKVSLEEDSIGLLLSYLF
jgi:hypothetical protein